MTETAASKFGGSPVNEPRSYRKKPVVIEAIRYNGHNFSAISVWAGADIAEHFSE